MNGAVSGEAVASCQLIAVCDGADDISVLNLEECERECSRDLAFLIVILNIKITKHKNQESNKAESNEIRVDLLHIFVCFSVSQNL